MRSIGTLYLHVNLGLIHESMTVASISKHHRGIYDVTLLTTLYVVCAMYLITIKARSILLYLNDTLSVLMYLQNGCDEINYCFSGQHSQSYLSILMTWAMRSIIGLLFLLRGLASAPSLYDGAQEHSALLHWDSDIMDTLQTGSDENSYIPLQRRSPGRNKGKKGRLMSTEEAILFAPAAPAGVSELVTDARNLAISSHAKTNIGSSGQPSSSKAGQVAKSEGKTKERGRPRKKLEDTKPSAPPLPNNQPATASSSQRRSPSPPFMLSEPGIRGEGGRQDQGGARTPTDRSSSPSGSRSPSRSISPPARSHSGKLESPARSRSPIRSPSGASTSSASNRQQAGSSRSPLHERPIGTPPIVDKKFDDWINSMTTMTEALKSHQTIARHAVDHTAIRTVKETKEAAKQTRDRADRSRIAATKLSDNQPVGSTEVGDAMKRADRHAQMAVKAMKSQTAAQTAATFALKGTEKHQDAIDYWKSSARQWIRAQARDAHRFALTSEHNARIHRKIAMDLPDNDPRRGFAFRSAAEAKKLATQEAEHYYRRRKQYGVAKEAFSDASSSSDEEWPLKDTPRPPE